MSDKTERVIDAMLAQLKARLMRDARAGATGNADFSVTFDSGGIRGGNYLEPVRRKKVAMK